MLGFPVCAHPGVSCRWSTQCAYVVFSLQITLIYGLQTFWIHVFVAQLHVSDAGVTVYRFFVAAIRGKQSSAKARSRCRRWRWRAAAASCSSAGTASSSSTSSPPKPRTSRPCRPPTHRRANPAGVCLSHTSVSQRCFCVDSSQLDVRE